TFCFSFVIESMQLIFRVGVFDVDDLLMNTIGGVIGYIVYKIARKIYYAWKRLV
ncbi:MAG: VanZ family protein, partial [Clostridiales bacterium]|nr:VanZ family protein [Clostridiales bacterium]